MTLPDHPLPDAAATGARPIRLLLDGRGRILLPPLLRQATGLELGQPLAIRIADDEIRVTPVTAPADAPADAPPADGQEPRLPTLDRKGRLTLPAPLRTALGLVPGAALLIQPTPPGLRMVTPGRLLGRLREARLALTRQLAQG